MRKPKEELRKRRKPRKEEETPQEGKQEHSSDRETQSATTFQSHPELPVRRVNPLLCRLTRKRQSSSESANQKQWCILQGSSVLALRIPYRQAHQEKALQRYRATRREKKLLYRLPVPDPKSIQWQVQSDSNRLSREERDAWNLSLWHSNQVEQRAFIKDIWLKYLVPTDRDIKASQTEDKKSWYRVQCQ